jgi:hypothetical protein
LGEIGTGSYFFISYELNTRAGLIIEHIKKQVESGEYRFTIHAFERCVERSISPVEIKEVILSGKIIEEYPQDKYGLSCLIWGITKKGKILHVQCSIQFGLLQPMTQI